MRTHREPDFSRRTQRLRALVLIAAGVLTLSGCGSSGGRATQPVSPSPAPSLSPSPTPTPNSTPTPTPSASPSPSPTPTPASTPTPSPSPSPLPPPPNTAPYTIPSLTAVYHLLWSDEFDSAVVDTGRWQYRTDTKWGSTQIPDNVTVSGGLLHIALRKQVVGASQYSAGGLISREQFRYGFYEARIRFPAKRSWHGAFWTMAEDPQNPGAASAAVARQELDVIEHDSGNNNFTVHIHTHHPADLNLGLKGITSKDLATGFHVFGCEFTPQEVRCFFDGRLVLTADVSTVEHDDQNIWLTCIRGPGAMDDTALPAEMVVDYVRFFAPEPQ